nr:PREDICTED: uncharacterized protein LOC105663408 [Megachile rotundata]
MSLTAEGHRASDDSKGANLEGDSVSIVGQQLRIPQFWPHKIALWFKLLEAQFASARITTDEVKFNITIANLGESYVEQVEDVVLDPPATGQYEYLKGELMKRLAESDSMRVRKLLEGEGLGDRTPSQFFQDLKKLATPSVPDDFIVTLWKNRLTVSVQRVLAATSETKPTVLAEMADRIHEIHPEQGRIAAITPKGPNEVDELRKMIERLEVRIEAMNRHRPRSVERKSHRSRSRSKEGKAELCWYHETFKHRAEKCRAPCTWASGNASGCQ